MARDLESLNLVMSADIRRMEKELAKASQVMNRRMNEVEARARSADKNLTRILGGAGTSMVAAFRNSLGAMAPTLAAAFSTAQVVKYADAYTGLQNRLKATGLEGEALKRVEDSLYAAANRNGVSVAATAELYQRAAMARENLGASEEQLLKIVSGTSAALKLQGTSATEASGALMQLGQLLGGNMVQAQEYNSLIDQLPVVLEAVAKGSDRWGGSVNKLTRDVKDGKVTVQDWSAAMLKGFADIEARAGKSTTTVAASLQTLNNQLGKFVGQTDSSLSATQRMAQGIEALANNLDVVATAGGVVVTVVGTRMVVANVAAATAAGANAAAQLSLIAAISGTSRAALTGAIAMRGLSAASLFFLTNPIGLAITGVALALGLVALRGREVSPAMKELQGQTARTTSALDAYEEAAKVAANATGQARVAALEHAAALREEGSEAVTTSRALLEKARAARIAAAQVEQAAAKAVMDRSVAGSNIGTLQQGQYATAKAKYEKAAAEEFQAGYDYAAAANRLQSVMTSARTGAYVQAPASATTGAGGSRSRSGPSPEDLAAQREMLRMQGELSVLQASGREDDARAVQRRIDLLTLTKQYEDAGFADAGKEAEAYLTVLHQAEDASRQLDKDKEGRLKTIEREAEVQQLLTDQTFARLQHEADLARLSGDPTRMEAAERELFIAQRINDLLRERPELDAAGRQSTAEGEWSALDNADREGQLRDEFRRSFGDGIKAALDGDLGGFFENLADRFTSQMLDNLADDLFDLFLNAGKGASGGGGWMASLLKGIPGFATGGRISGPGTGKSDSIPIMASAGEFIVNAQATKTFQPLQEAINKGKLPRFAQGGIIATNEAGSAERFTA